MYRITAIINKVGGSPVSWTYYSAYRLTQVQCENMLSRDKEVGKGHGFRVMLTKFCCEKVKKRTDIRSPSVYYHEGER